jgi:glyoxalase family protein
VRTGLKGAGQVSATAFSVPEGSLDFWRGRLAGQAQLAETELRFGEKSIVVTDPSGLAIELVATGRDTREPWTGGGVEPEAAIRGLHSVSMVVNAPERTVRLMSDLLGLQIVDEADGRIRMGAASAAPGQTVDVVYDPDAPRAANGLGTVHHVAFAIGSEEEQLALREELIDRNIGVTDVLDRQYFKSIYFREPGGVLFEVATVAPGFTFDEPLPCLGQDLKLPPWEEPNRGVIEAGLPPIEIRGTR